MLFVSVRGEEYIVSGRDKFIVDPDLNQICTKRKKSRDVLFRFRVRQLRIIPVSIYFPLFPRVTFFISATFISKSWSWTVVVTRGYNVNIRDIYNA